MGPNQQRILIVDDSAFVRLGLRHYLENQGYRVSDAADADEAMELFEQQEPDLAILDISLQVGPDGKEGLSLARKIKAINPTLGIIFLSGSPSYYQEFLDISRKYKGIAYLYKGSNFRDELLMVMDLVSKRGVWVAPEIASYEELSVSVPITKAEQEIIKDVLSHFNELSDKEIKIVESVAMSNENREIADQQYITMNTVSAHMTHIYAKLGLGDEISKVEKRSLLAKSYWLHQKMMA